MVVVCCMVQYHTHSTKKATNVMSFVLPKSKLSPEIKRSILTPPSKIISCSQSGYIKDWLHGSTLGGGVRIGRLFLGESFKVRKYVKKVVFETVRYKGVPHRMKTCQHEYARSELSGNEYNPVSVCSYLYDILFMYVISYPTNSHTINVHAERRGLHSKYACDECTWREGTSWLS